MKIVYDKQGRALVVSDDFDTEEESSSSSDENPSSDTGTPLPEGFPNREALINSDLATLEKVQAWLDDPNRVKIPSVGDKSLELIKAALAEARK